jgi:hypothetical protein
MKNERKSYELKRQELFNHLCKLYVTKKINENCYNVLYIKNDDCDCFRNIPSNINTIIIKKFINLNNINIPVNVKRIIFKTEHASKSIKKIPYGCKVVIYEYEYNYSFNKFLRKHQNIISSEIVERINILGYRFSSQMKRNEFSYSLKCSRKIKLMQSMSLCDYISLPDFIKK